MHVRKCEYNLFTARVNSPAQNKTNTATHVTQANDLAVRSRHAPPFLAGIDVGSPASSQHGQRSEHGSSEDRPAASKLTSSTCRLSRCLRAPSLARRGLFRCRALRARRLAAGRISSVVAEQLQRETSDLATGRPIDLVRRLCIHDLDELSIRRLVNAFLDESVAARADGRKGEVRVKSIIRNELFVALRGLNLGVGRLHLGRVEFVKLLLKGVIVAAEGDGAVVVDDCDAVVGFLLAVLVDEAAAQRSHVIAVEGCHLVEDTRHDLVATVLGEENGDTTVLEHIDKLVVSCALEGGITTAPGVRVEAKDVRFGAIAVIVALHVRPGIFQDLADISSGVSNRDGAVSMLLDV